MNISDSIQDRHLRRLAVIYVRQSSPNQLLDLCGRTDCLIADRDGVYDPTSINGRLLLGLKGQISELELYTLHTRLTAGIISKAERGELALTLPTGLVRLESGQVIKHPETIKWSHGFSKRYRSPRSMRRPTRCAMPIASVTRYSPRVARKSIAYVIKRGLPNASSCTPIPRIGW